MLELMCGGVLVLCRYVILYSISTTGLTENMSTYLWPLQSPMHVSELVGTVVSPGVELSNEDRRT